MITRRHVRCGALLVGLLAAATAVEAQVPKVMRYQGQAVDSQNVPLEGAYTLTFRLYDAASGGTKVWEEIHSGVPLSQGYFSVLLGGRGKPLAVDWSKPCWLAVQVNGEAEMTPRQDISTVPMAALAEHLDGPICTLNNKAGVLTKAANAKLQVGDCAQSYLNYDFVVAATDAGNLSRFVTFSDRLANTGASSVGFERTRGTAAAPAPLQTGDWLGGLDWNGQVTSGVGIDTMLAARIHAVADAPFSKTIRRAALVFSTIPNGLADPAESARITPDGFVAIGTTTAANILTVQQFSSTDPKADSWTTYTCDRTSKDILGSARNVLAQLKSTPVYEWRRKPIVSDDEVDRAILRDRADRTRTDQPTAAERDAKHRELAQAKAMLPKFATKRIGISIDDANVPAEVLVFDEDGRKTGVDLLAYVGYLHAALQQVAVKLDELEARTAAPSRP